MSRVPVRLTVGLLSLLVSPQFLYAQAIDEVLLERPVGAPVRALVSGPAEADAAILFLHDWFGISNHTRDALGRLAGLGYRAMALDLYDGESAETHARAGALSGALDAAEVQSKLETGLAALRDAGFERIGTLGFSMGGNPAFTAARLGGADASAAVYGGGMEVLSDDELQTLGFPLLLVTGSDDDWPMGTIQALLPRMKNLEVYVYPNARHGYAQPLFAGGANLDEEATETTWEVIEAFLDRNLGS
jgi:carboxymethylenebutenolidase